MEVKRVRIPYCVLYLWTTFAHAHHAHWLLDQWGFEYKSQHIWKKPGGGTGYWGIENGEILLVATRGSVPCPAPGTQLPYVIEAPRGEPSEKPHPKARDVRPQTSRPLGRLGQRGMTEIYDAIPRQRRHQARSARPRAAAEDLARLADHQLADNDHGIDDAQNFLHAISTVDGSERPPRKEAKIQSRTERRSVL